MSSSELSRLPGARPAAGSTARDFSSLGAVVLGVAGMMALIAAGLAVLS